MSSRLILDSLEIKNFRAFRHLQIEKLGRVNLITGKNNVGKSTLLEALWFFINEGHPKIVWKILESRNEGRRPIVGEMKNTRSVLQTLGSVFWGLTQWKDGETFEVGSLNDKSRRVSFRIIWFNVASSGGISRVSSNPLPDEAVLEHYAGELAPGALVQSGNDQSREYLLDSALVGLNPRIVKNNFIEANGLVPELLPALWDSVSLTSGEEDVLKSLRIIAPSVEKLAFIADLQRFQDGSRVPIVKTSGVETPIPLKRLGDGMNRLLGIALAQVNAKDDFLLIDEIENGLHYSIQPDVWRLIFETARRLNVQVFATTHSWDCIEAFQRAAQENEEEGVLIRLVRRGEDIIAKVFSEEEVGIATQQEIELR